MEVTYYGAKELSSIIKDTFRGIGTSALRNLRQIFERVVVTTKALDSLSTGHGFDYSGIRDSYRADTISFEKGQVAEAEKLTAFYIGECIGDVATAVVLIKGAKAATAGGSRGSMGGRNVMTANMVTADGTVVAVEVESGGAVAGVVGGFPDPGYGSGYGSGGGDDSFGNLWESIFGVKQMAEGPGAGGELPKGGPKHSTDKNAKQTLSGHWEDVNESMGDFSSSYQKQVTGQMGKAWIQNGVKFDGMKGGVLVDAKGKYSQFINPNNGRFYEWFTGKESLVEQAMRQIHASEGARIQWYFAEQESLNAVQRLFLERGITGIELIFQMAK